MTASTFKTIEKPAIDKFDVTPNLDRDNVREFDWQDLYSELDWLPGGGLNKAHEAIDRHANGPKRDKIALIWEGKNGEREDYTFGQMKEETDKFANVLKSLGIETGDRVFLFMDRLPELYFAFFGILKAGAIAGPLFSAFGPDPVKDRMIDSGAKVLVTQPDLRRKIAGIIPELFDLQHIIIVNKDGRDPAPIDTQDLDYYAEMGKAPSEFSIVNTSQYDYSIMHYTSGTTGKPKGAVHRHQAAVQQYATGKWALDLHEDDIYWCTADPGWVTGTSYGMMAPWTNGVTQLIYEGGFRASAWYEQIQKHKVTVWYTAPTAIRMLMKAGDEVPKRYDLSSLRYINSVGEPLNPEVIEQVRRAWGVTIRDGFGQTETTCQIGNSPGQPIIAGSMGRPLPGFRVALVDADDHPVSEGEIALPLDSSPLGLMAGYANAPEATAEAMRNGYYHTSDVAIRRDDGYYVYVGRVDDVFKCSDYRLSPFELESVLIEHIAIAEAAVVPSPDPVRLAVPKAYITLGQGHEAGPELAHSVFQFLRGKLAPYKRIRRLEFAELPKTISGKIRRVELRKREMVRSSDQERFEAEFWEEDFPDLHR